MSAAWASMSSDKLNVFVSYSHHDKQWLERVRVHLKPLARDGKLDLWDDTRIKTGQLWRAEIEAALGHADVAVLLISADFYASDFIAQGELPPLLHAAQSGGGLVILGVHINYSHFEDDEILSEYQTVNTPGEPIEALTSRGQQERVFRDLARRIRELVPRRDPGGPVPPGDGANGGDAGWSIDTTHEELTARLLGAEDVRDFRAALRAELEREFDLDPAPETAVSIVQWFSRSPKEPADIRHLLFAVRRALRSLDRTPSRDRRTRRAVEEAAAALYCLCACRFVDHAAHRAGDYVLRMPRMEAVVYAVIATALFGGELRLMEADQSTLPQPDYVFEVSVPAGGRHVETDFERAVYIALFPNREETTQLALDTGPLTSAQRGRLITRLDTLKHVERVSFALVVRGGLPETWPGSHETPVIVPDDDAASALLHIDPAVLAGHIEEFWGQIRSSRPSDSKDRAQSHPQQLPPSQGSSGTAPSGVSIVARDGATIAVTTGNASPARAHQQRDGPDPAALGEVVKELLRAIEEFSSPEARATLTPHVDAVKEEARKERPDAGRIRQALDAIDCTVKKSSGILEGGERIAGLLYRAYQHLAPFF